MNAEQGSSEAERELTLQRYQFAREVIGNGKAAVVLGSWESTQKARYVPTRQRVGNVQSGWHMHGMEENI
jgi:hypothetical protein